jgi:hypothetical protein
VFPQVASHVSNQKLMRQNPMPLVAEHSRKLRRSPDSQAAREEEETGISMSLEEFEHFEIDSAEICPLLFNEKLTYKLRAATAGTQAPNSTLNSRQQSFIL